MNKKIRILAIIISAILSIAGCSQSLQSEDENPKAGSDSSIINISAAASLTDALLEIQQEYIKENNVELQFNFGASGSLQKQIEEGAPCDIFMSASKKNMDNLEAINLIDSDSRIDLLGNTLTFIVSQEKKQDSGFSFEYLSEDSIKSIAIGMPDSVPAGKYTKESMESIGIWEDIQPKVVFAKDVRQVLDYVDTGNADCGFVYRTDAVTLKTGEIVCDLPQETYSPIVYPMALTLEGSKNQIATDFCEYLKNDYSKSVFEKFGFKVM